MIDNQTAINTLDAMKKQFLGETREVLDMAIHSIEEVQQYRAIGTVEEVKTLHNDYWKLNEICKEYSAIGTVSEFRELKEKATAKKPIQLGNNGDIHECPICGGYAENNWGSAYRFCPNCGTEFDWSEEEE